MKNFFQKYKHAWVSIYALIYLPWFYYLEKTITQNYNLIQTSFDKKIPFIEFFIIPYLFWFLFMAITVCYFFFKDRNEFYRLILFLVIGMTLFLIISTLWPNGQALRPKYFERDNIFVDMVKRLYSTDTPTNVFPSIHVNNSICASAALLSSEKLRGRKGWRVFAVVMAGLIILSTMFLKQHSVIDVTAGMVTGFLSVEIFFGNELKGLAGRVRFKLIQRTRSCL